MHDPAEPSQDEVMSQIFGVSVEEYRASLFHRQSAIACIMTGRIEEGKESLNRWRALRPKFETRT
jgi:hypothetical protein